MTKAIRRNLLDLAKQDAVIRTLLAIAYYHRGFPDNPYANWLPATRKSA